VGASGVIALKDDFDQSAGQVVESQGDVLSFGEGEADGGGGAPGIGIVLRQREGRRFGAGCALGGAQDTAPPFLNHLQPIAIGIVGLNAVIQIVIGIGADNQAGVDLFPAVAWG